MLKKALKPEGLSLARDICLAFNVSQSMNFLKHLQSLCFIKLKPHLIEYQIF